jgi:hypothetical protein
MMIDILINISKVSIKSIFAEQKQNPEFLDEDLQTISFIRNLLDKKYEFVKNNHPEINAEKYLDELKKYARQLFSIQCQELLSEEEKNSDGFNLENYKAENDKYFNYIYSNQQYPDR